MTGVRGVASENGGHGSAHDVDGKTSASLDWQGSALARARTRGFADQSLSMGTPRGRGLEIDEARRAPMSRVWRVNQSGRTLGMWALQVCL